MYKPSSLAPLLLVTLACAATSLGSAAPPIRNGEELIRAMHERYADRWYRSLSFTQQTRQHRPDGSVVDEEWREWAAIPGRLRIEMGPAEAGRGALFRGDSLYIFHQGRPVRAEKGRNSLMILGFDVYRQPPERTLAQLREEGFALSPLRADTWQGRPVYVVGAAEGHSRTPQFWIDRERLVFVTQWCERRPLALHA